MAQDWFDSATSQSAATAPKQARGGWIDDPFKKAADRRAEESQGLDRERVDIAREAGARADRALANSQRLTDLAIARFQAEQEAKKNPQLTPAKRAEILDKRVSLNNLAAGLSKLRKQYGESFKGRSPAEYLPTTARPANGVFNDTSGGLSAYVAAALGLSGQQFNTPAEQQLFIGSILPRASDTDEQIENKLSTLSDLLANADRASAAQLGIAPAFGQVDGGGNPPAGPTQIDPTGGNPLLSPEDAAELSKSARYMTPQTMQQWFAERGLRITPEEAQKNYEYYAKGGQQDAAINVPQGEGSAFGQVAASPFGTYVASAGDMLTGGTLDEVSTALGGDGAAFNQALEAGRELNPWANFAGSITGGYIGTLGAGKLVGAIPGIGARAASVGGGIVPDLLYGAGYGAGSADDGDRIMGAVTGAGLAGAGNVVGQGIVGGGGRALRGISDPVINALVDAGVPLTGGQMLSQSGIAGKAIKGLEDKFESIPLLGEAIKARRLEGLEAYDREGFRQALEPINAQVQGAVGNDAIEQAQDLVGQAYQDALGTVRLTPDSQYQQDIAAALAAGQALPGPLADTFSSMVANRVDPMLTTGAMDGRGLQAAIKGLRMDSGAVLKKSEPMADLLKDRTVSVEEALLDLAERQAPGTGEALRNANSAYRNLAILEDATLAADNNQGIWTAAQLGRSQINNAKRFGGKKAAARGDLPFTELQRQGQQVLPSTTPNTGTNDRALATWILPSALGGAAATGEATDYLPPSVTIPLALAGLATTRGGRTGLEKALMGRNDTFRSLGTSIYDRRGLGGDVAAILALQYGGQ